MEFSDYLNKAFVYFQHESWVIQVFVVVFITLLARFFQKRIFLNLFKKLSKTKTLWDEAMVSSMSKPLGLFIWIIGLSFAAEIAQSKTEAAIFKAIDPLREVGVIIALVWFVIRFIKQAEHNIVRKYENSEVPIDRTTADAIAKLLRVSAIITATLVIIQTLGYSISGVLAFGGIGGIAIGFAAKDLLANFFGGLMIYLDRPFNVGDWIYSPDKEIEGTVENIGWRLTTIRTFAKRPVYVPNAIFANIAVVNPSRMTNRRIYETIGIRYKDADKMADIVKDVKDMLLNHPEIDTKQALIVNFNKFAPSSLDFIVYTLTKTTNWFRFHEIKQDVMLKIIEIIKGHGAECAFPTSSLYIESNGAQGSASPGGV